LSVSRIWNTKVTSDFYPELDFPVLSHYQTTPLLDARKNGRSDAATSLDLGISMVQVQIQENGAVLPDATLVGWDIIEEINSSENACFSIRDNILEPIRGFSESLGRACSLMPTSTAPIMVIAGFPMHRFKDITPIKAALAMIEPLAPLSGNVLDTATGLGYTAIEAAKRAMHVTTIELCPVAREMARMNPWSQPLFGNPGISPIMGDSYEEIRKLPDGLFSAVIHDPPTLSLAGDLYSGEFYRQVFRVLNQRGKMFHYIGDPQSATGSRVTRGVVKRLFDAGFSRVEPVAKAFGVVARK
jgi:uncharacterized protein